MKAIFIIFISIFHISVFACLNEHHITKLGKKSVDKFSMQDVRFLNFFEKSILEKNNQILLSEKPTNEDDILTNQTIIAINYIQLGKLEESEKILNNLYKKHNKEYSVIINLGTLYELQGKNQKALEYIKRAVAINPNSHNGSEWFHIKVLEFKLKNISPKNIFNTNILEIEKIRNKSANEIAFDISYQLKERIPFTPIPNLMMAKILEEYGNLLADSISIKGAIVIYEIGMYYDINNDLNLSKKREALLPFFKKYQENIPSAKDYFIDEKTNASNVQKGEIITTLLDNSIKNVTKLEQKKAKKESNRLKLFLLVGGIGLITIFGFIFFKNKTK